MPLRCGTTRSMITRPAATMISPTTTRARPNRGTKRLPRVAAIADPMANGVWVAPACSAL